MSRLVAHLAPLALVLAALAPARAQERPPIREHTFLPEEDWARLGPEHVGKKLYLEGRWEELYGDWALLWKGPIVTRGLLWVPANSAIKLVLSRDRDSANEPLTSKISSVRVFGEGVKAGDDRVLIKVSRVDKLPEEDQQFLERLQAVGADADAIQRLAKECAERAKRFDDARLREVARSISRRELEVRAAALAPDDHAGRLTLAQRSLDEADDPHGAIELFGAIVESEGVPAQVHARAVERLEQLRAVRTLTTDGGVEWVAYDVYKREEGFILRADTSGTPTWMSREVVELHLARDAELARQQQKIELPRSNPIKHLKDAEAKVVERGQTFPEVRLAGGFPVVVRHERGGSFLGEESSVWSQWILADGRRVYFVNGEVISWKAATDPWPSGSLGGGSGGR